MCAVHDTRMDRDLEQPTILRSPVDRDVRFRNEAQETDRPACAKPLENMPKSPSSLEYENPLITLSALKLEEQARQKQLDAMFSSKQPSK